MNNDLGRTRSGHHPVYFALVLAGILGSGALGCRGSDSPEYGKPAGVNEAKLDTAGKDTRDAHPASLVGGWIRVFPPAGALDTLILHVDGRIAGSVRGLDSLGFPMTHWRVGSSLSPDDFCLNDGERQQLCQGFKVSGDTLRLANGRSSVYLRLTAQPPRVYKTWLSPKGEAVPPTPGGGAPVPPPSVQKKGAT